MAVTHSAIALCTTFLFLPHFDVICDLLLNRRTATWNLFVNYTIRKHATSAIYFKIFLNYSKTGLCSHEKKPFDVISCLHKMKQSHWLLCITRNCDWSRKITPLSNLIQTGFSWNENLQRKQNWTAKSTNVKVNAGKINLVFVIRAALWAQKLEYFLEYCWSWKNILGKHAVAVNAGRHLIRVLHERKVTDGGNLCPLWLVILKLVWHGIGETLWLQYSWPRAVVSYTFLAVVSWLEHSRRKVRLRLYSRIYFNWI